jgi:hypothetical protein
MMFSRAARRAGGSEPSRLIASAPTVNTSAIGLGRKPTTDGSRLGQDHAQGEPPAGSHSPQQPNFTTPLEHRERQRADPLAQLFTEPLPLGF